MSTGETLLKVPPQSLDAEQSVLGGILLEEMAITRVLDILRPEDFYRENHRKIYSAMIDLFEAKEPVDIITLSEILTKKGTLDKAGGVGYITSLVDNVPTAANIEYYAKIVKEKAILRNLISASTEIIADSYEAKQDIDDLLGKAENKIFEISEHKISRSFYHIQPVSKESISIIEHLYRKDMLITGVPTGFRDIDDMTGGLQPSDLVIIAGRPSMGKTAFALNIALNAASRRDNPVAVAIFSIEMSREQLAMRMLSSEARIELNRIRTGKIEHKEWIKLTGAAADLGELNIYIDDSAGLNPLEMRAKARRLKAEADIGMVIVDYLQLMTSVGRFERRDLEISEITRSLKAMAKELRVPVVALSQLSRAVEGRENKRPILADLRESGAIEQDADVIMFIYRDDVYRRDSDEREVTGGERGIAEIIIGKQRNGPTGTKKLTFVNQYTRFEDFTDRKPF
jgi:replicative DNA helicase